MIDVHSQRSPARHQIRWRLWTSSRATIKTFGLREAFAGCLLTWFFFVIAEFRNCIYTKMEIAAAEAEWAG